jgi:hypothetical protein
MRTQGRIQRFYPFGIRSISVQKAFAHCHDTRRKPPSTTAVMHNLQGNESLILAQQSRSNQDADRQRKSVARKLAQAAMKITVAY